MSKQQLYAGRDEMEENDRNAAIEERRRKRKDERLKRRREKNIKRLRIMIPILCAAAATAALLWNADGKTEAAQSPESVVSTATGETEEADPPFSASETADTAELGDDIESDYAVIINVSTGEIVAEKNARTPISIASMTKILTLLVASENLTAGDLDKTVEITTAITDICYKNGCSVTGFVLGEKPTVRDLLYGAILPSGADAVLALAYYVAGSQEAFVTMMNDELDALGLAPSAHFTNCIGLFDSEHYCSVYDMAVIMKAASDVEICREVMSAHTYSTAPTTQHPDGMILSNWFLRRIEDKDCGSAKVLCAKTGYVTQSGSCAASLSETKNGERYICVTAMAGSSWSCIYDHAALYKRFAAG